MHNAENVGELKKNIRSLQSKLRPWDQQFLVQTGAWLQQTVGKDSLQIELAMNMQLDEHLSTLKMDCERITRLMRAGSAPQAKSNRVQKRKAPPV